MDTQKIQISEVKDTAPLSIIQNEADFLLRLQQNNITKYPDPQKIQIQKDGDRYIFTLFNDNRQETKFALANGYDVEKFLLAFLDEQKKADQKTATETIAVQLTGLEKNELTITRGISQEIKTLKDNILAHHERTTNPDVIKRRINELKNFFDEQKNDGRREQFWLTSKYARSKQERRYREMHKNEAKRRLDDLGNVKKTMKELENANFSDPNIKNKLKNISQQLDKLADNVPLFESQDEAMRSGTADVTPNYTIDATKFSKKDAKDYLKALESFNKRQAQVDAITGKGTAEQMRAKDLIDFQKYLDGVMNGEIDPILYPYTPKNKEEYEYITDLLKKLQNEHPYLAKNIVIKNPTGVEQVTTTGGTGGDNLTGSQDNTGIDNTKKNMVQDANGNRVDATATGGLFGTLDHATDKWQDKSERGQNFYKSFGNVALLAGGIFLGIKAIGATWRIIRGKEKKGDRGRLGGTAGLLLLTAGRPQDLFKGGYASEKFADLLKMIGFGGGKENQSNSPMQAVEQSTTGAMTLFNGMKYEDMKKIIKPDSDGKMKLDPEYRQKQLDTAKIIATTGTGLDKANAEAKIKFLEAIGKDDPRGLINLALVSMGMNWNALNDSANANKLFDTGAEAYIQRTLVLAELMNSKKYQKTNNESDAKIQEYMQGKITLDELEASGAFEKPVALDQAIKDKLRGQVEALGITDLNQKQNLLEAVYQFYQDWNATDKSTFKIEKDAHGNIVVSTYGEKTPIALDKKIVGLPITFETIKESLRVANLTNKIKSLSRKLTPNKKPPFYLDITGEISFDTSKIYEVWKQDLTLISKEGLKDVSRKLSEKENKQTYVNYLNGLGVRGGGENQDVTEAIIPATVIAGGAALDATDEVEENDSNIIDQAEFQKDIDEINKLDLSEAAKEKIKKDYKEFYQKYPSFKTIGVELIADGKVLKVISYHKETPIDFNKNQVAGLNIDFGNFEDLFKTANLTNKIRSTFENTPSKSLVDPFHQDINLDIKFDDKSIWNRRPDVGAVSDGLWRGSLRTVSPKLTETSNKQLYTEYLNNLWLIQDKAEGFFPVIENFTNSDTRKKIIDGFKAFYKDHPSEEKNIKFEKDEKGNVSLKTYEQSTPIDLTSKKITGLSLSFETYEELFKVANAINKAKSITIDKETKGDSDDDAFDTTYLGALEFYGKEKTIRVFSEDGLTKNSKKFDERSNKLLLESYLNNRWKSIHQTTPQQ